MPDGAYQRVCVNGAERRRSAAPPPIDWEDVLTDIGAKIGPISLDAQRRRLQRNVSPRSTCDSVSR
jgi:hypothetical protein